jgi:hypothetical protein
VICGQLGRAIKVAGASGGPFCPAARLAAVNLYTGETGRKRHGLDGQKKHFHVKTLKSGRSDSCTALGAGQGQGDEGLFFPLHALKSIDAPRIGSGPVGKQLAAPPLNRTAPRQKSCEPRMHRSLSVNTCTSSKGCAAFNARVRVRASISNIFVIVCVPSWVTFYFFPFPHTKRALYLHTCISICTYLATAVSSIYLPCMQRQQATHL